MIRLNVGGRTSFPKDATPESVVELRTVSVYLNPEEAARVALSLLDGVGVTIDSDDGTGLTVRITPYSTGG